MDSIPGIAFSFQTALAHVCPGRAVPNFVPFIGPPVREVFRRALPESDPGILEALERSFRESYDNDGWRKVMTNGAVESVLVALRKLGVQCYVLTNKPKTPTLKILNHLSLAGYFEEVITPDSRAPRYATKTEAALEARQRRGLSGAEVLLVGDSTDDGAAAEACGFRFGAVSFGYGDAAAYPHVHFHVDKFEDLLRIYTSTPAMIRPL